MKEEILLEYANILMNVIANIKIKELNSDGENKLKGIYFHEDGTERLLYIQYFPEFNSIKASTDLPRLSDFRLAVQTIEVLDEIKKNNIKHEDLEIGIMTPGELVQRFKDDTNKHNKQWIDYIQITYDFVVPIHGTSIFLLMVTNANFTMRVIGTIKICIGNFM